METTSVEKFYSEISEEGSRLFPKGIEKEIGHFNIFNTAEVRKKFTKDGKMPYNRRTYYKISLIKGRNRAEYADKVIEIDQYALLFASPNIPYNYIPMDENQGGHFCVFTEDFMLQEKSGLNIVKAPIFQPGGSPIYQLTESQVREVENIFQKMEKEIASDYAYKYDLLRNYLSELIHYGQKLQPASSLYSTSYATERVSSLFMELLERQFPIESTDQKLKLRSPKEFADTLSIHVNYLNKILKDKTNSTTTDLINKRILNEAKILLKQTNWNVSEIGFALGFEEVAHFSNFFKKHEGNSPNTFRS